MADEWCWLLAQAAGKDQSYLTMMPFFAIAILFFVLMIWGPQREKQKRESAINALKQNDRVVTIGGIIGTIANVSPDGKEITLKVDEKTRIKFTRSGIAHKLTDEPTKDEPGKLA